MRIRLDDSVVELFVCSTLGKENDLWMFLIVMIVMLMSRRDEEEGRRYVYALRPLFISELGSSLKANCSKRC